MKLLFNTKVSHIITRSSLYLHLFPPFIHRNFMNICCITTMFKHGISYIQIAFSIPTCTSKRRKRGTHEASNNKCKICFEFRFHDKFSKKNNRQNRVYQSWSLEPFQNLSDYIDIYWKVEYFLTNNNYSYKEWN